MVRLGSHPRAFVLPLLVGDVKKGIPVGDELTISYWRVRLVPAVRLCYQVYGSLIQARGLRYRPRRGSSNRDVITPVIKVAATTAGAVRTPAQDGLFSRLEASWRLSGSAAMF